VLVRPLDLVALVIGSLFVTIGAIAISAALSSRPRINRSAAWFGVFCVLYGVRLVVGSELLRVATQWPPGLLAYLRADITYAILVPATLFVESIVGAGRYMIVRRAWQVSGIAALVGIGFDVIVQRPFAAVVINPPLVVLNIAVWFWQFAADARQERWSPEVRGVTGAGALLALAALFETLFSRGVIGDILIEPVAMLVFAGALGWFVLTRARQQETSYAALSRELDLARSIQQSLLPMTLPERPGIRLTTAYLPMSAVAGDFYDVVPLTDGRTLVLIADVSGHGVPAALIAAMVKVAVAAEADRHDDPGEILTGINCALTGKFERAYVTACCLAVDPNRRTLSYATAGHPPPLLRRADGRIEPLDRGGVVLTLFPGTTYEHHEVRFDAGDRVLMYTDGLTEAARRNGDEYFGDAEFARVVSSTPASQDLLHNVLDAHRRWIGEGTPVSDDISIVVIECVQAEQWVEA
jgi:phosphoserine phosphatase RsbU/P